MQISLNTSLAVQHFLIATVATAPQPIINALAIFCFYLIMELLAVKI
jgi:hypothetical protein